MIAAGLLARNAVERGLTSKPWVKTSLAPGSKVVTEYLRVAGLTPYLNRLGFNLVGYGCTTCIGNSGPLPDEVSAEVDARSLVVASVLSGNRNFEGRFQQQVRANYLASPPLVVAYALAGRMTLDLTTEPLGVDSNGKPVYLRELWPAERDIQSTMLAAVRADMFREQYANVFAGDERWQSLPVPTGDRFVWEPDSTYIRNPPFFEELTLQPAALRDISGARVLALLGDSITTDHISPAGSIKKDSPAGKYLMEHGVEPHDFNSYGARRGNHEVMMRGTFANIRLRNQLAPGTEGGWTTYQPDGEVMTIYDAAMTYKAAAVPLVILAGKESAPDRRATGRRGRSSLGVKPSSPELRTDSPRQPWSTWAFCRCSSAGASAASLGLTGRKRYDLAGVSVCCGRAACHRTRPATPGAVQFRRSRGSLRPKDWSPSSTAASCRMLRRLVGDKPVG
jgi:aconitate hydratase